MSEKLTIQEVQDAYVEGVEHDCFYEGDVKRTPDGLLEAERFREWLAEVERAAAEKAWDRCVGEMPIDPDWKNFYGDNNPYRAAALGLTAGEEGEKA